MSSGEKSLVNRAQMILNLETMMYTLMNLCRRTNVSGFAVSTWFCDSIHWEKSFRRSNISGCAKWNFLDGTHMTASNMTCKPFMHVDI